MISYVPPRDGTIQNRLIVSSVGGQDTSVAEVMSGITDANTVATASIRRARIEVWQVA